MALDWRQTKTFIKNPRFIESNKILGEHPSQNSVDIYMAIFALTHTGITHILPQKYRKYFQMIFIISESSAVYNNHQLGIRIKF